MIQATSVTKSFGPVNVLRGIDFQAADREVVSIVGASGAGKSTLLQILGSLSRPDTGKVIIDGTDIFSLSSDALADFRNRRIGFVFQFHHLLPEFTALENVMIPALIARKGASDARRQASELLSSLGLSHRLEHKPAELSGGEQQRVAIARAVDIHQLFFDLRDRFGQTVIIVTHDRDLAAMSDRMLEMRDGLFCN